MGDLWVFGYGSLMWRPGFAHVETHRARLFGYRRALCIASFVHRGTPERPGLVLGLDRGGSCLGLAFRVPGEREGEVIDYLRERELVTNVYLERRLPIRLDNGQMVEGVQDVVLVRAGTPDRADHPLCRLVGVERSGILLMSSVDHVGDGLDHLSVVEPDRQPAFEIDVGDQLALAQVIYDLAFELAGNAEGQAKAGAAAVEAEHQSRPFRRAAMHERGDAQRAPVSEKPRPVRLDMREARPPHQRAVAEHP